MDYITILQRAFRITIKYRALWIFGFFLALCSASSNLGGNGGSGSGGPDQSGNGFDKSEFDVPFESFAMPEANIWLIVAGIVAAILCLILVFVVIGIIVRAVTRTALIGMVDQVEETEAVTVRDGWRMGWSKRAWTVFAVSFIIIAPLIVLFGVLLALFLLPLLLLFLENGVLTFVGIAGVAGLMLLWILAVIIVTIAVTPLLEFGWRYAVLHQRGAVDSVQAAYALIRHNFKDVAIILLLLTGIIMVWILASIILFIVLMLLGLAVGIIPGLIAFLLSQTWWIGLLVGMAPFMVIVMVPMVFAKGLYLTFRSVVWTLVFRELTLTGAISAESIGPSEAADNNTDAVPENEPEEK